MSSLSTGHDTILVFSKNKDVRLNKLTAISDDLSPGKWDTFWRGTDRPTMRYELFGKKPETGQWRWSENRTNIAKINYEKYLNHYSSQMSLDEYFGLELQETGKEIEFVRQSDDGVVQYYVAPRNYKILSDVWMDVSTSGGSTEFSHEKHEALLDRIIRWLSNEGDIVLDFHIGSGTTASVAHKIGRRYIGIEQMDYINDITVPRLQKVIDGEQGGISKDVGWQGGGSFVYAELMELNAYFVHEIQKAQSTEELEKLFAVMKTEAHLNYQVALENVLSAEYEMDGIPRKVAFSELELHEQKQLLIEILDKNQLYVNASDMDDSDLNISESDKAFTRSFYGME
ncbi:site-specific DNA-methyltransferase [Escherichia coli]|nr:site-specific DNA-methyltransferase [Escherichia coli]